MTDPQIAIQLHWVAQSIHDAGSMLTEAIVYLAFMYVIFTKK